jgi:hypothetical protein
MFRIRKSPFGRHEDPAKHMVLLLSEEAEESGAPLSEEEKEVLAREAAPREPLPEELRQRVRRLIEQILERERGAATEAGPKSFLNSLEWAGDQDYPNIVALTEEVILGGGFGELPPVHGRAWIKDKALLIGFALAAVFLMMVVVVIVGFLHDLLS